MDKDFEPTLIDIAREFLEKVTMELDPYVSKKGVIETRTDSVVLLTPSHIQFAKYGRAPGKRPPLDPILEWIKKKNVKFGNSSERGTAFAIQAMIAKYGTKFYVPNAPNALEDAINKNFDEYNKKLAFSLSVEVNDILKGVYEPVFSQFKNFDI